MALRWFRPSDSSAVERAAYDPGRRELHIVFSGGREYAYARVPERVFEDLQRAPSVGQFVNWEVKPVYRFREVEPVRRTPVRRRTLGQPAPATGRGLPDRRAHR